MEPARTEQKANVSSTHSRVAVVGAGLAGSDCAWVLAEGYGCDVTLYEMKSKEPTPAQSEPHHFAELVCSNSLKSKSLLNPAGLLKQELEALGSLVLQSARESEVPAGESLAVDRILFSGAITRTLRAHPRISVVEEVVRDLASLEEKAFDASVLATGPLTHDALAADIRRLTGEEALSFYDAIAPIVDGDTVDMSIAFIANRAMRSKAFEVRTGLSVNFDAQNAEDSKEELPEAAVSEVASEDATPVGDYLNLPLSNPHSAPPVMEIPFSSRVRLRRIPSIDPAYRRRKEAEDLLTKRRDVCDDGRVTFDRHDLDVHEELHHPA